MKNVITHQILSLRFLSFTLVMMTALSSCQEDVLPNVEIVDRDALTDSRAVYSSRSVSFTKSDGPYSEAEASSDFGNISGWDASSAYISSNIGRIKLLANLVGSPYGMVSEIDVSDGAEYELEYKVKFHSAFEWARGGKLGFGFKIGDGVVGCQGDDARDGDGGSFRVMWYNENNNDTDVYFYPYLYFSGMTVDCGDTYRATNHYPSTGAISRGIWYTIKLYYKANTGTSSNGIVRMYVNNTLVLDENNIQWSTSSSNKTVQSIYFSVFRGGSESSSNADDWRSSSTGYIYFDDLTWTRL